MMNEKATKTFTLMFDLKIATLDEMNLVMAINGYKLETLNDILYVRIGYRDIDSYLAEEM